MNTLGILYLYIISPIIVMYAILAIVMILADFISGNAKFSLFVVDNIVIHRSILVIGFIIGNILFALTH